MAKIKNEAGYDLMGVYKKRLAPRVKQAPWVLRITELKDKPAPVLIVKERCMPELLVENSPETPARILVDRGFIYGQSLRRCLPVIQMILNEVVDEAGIPLDMSRYVPKGTIDFRGNLPLNQTAGTKLALIFKLQERISDQDRIELLAWRVERFTTEEAAYWLSRATQYGKAANGWAQAGLRIVLGGQPGDKAVIDMLASLRK